MKADRHDVLIGKVVAAHGLRGEVKVRLYQKGSRVLDDLSHVLLRDEQGAETEWRITGVRSTPRGDILRLAGLTDRSGAELLVHRELAVRRDWLPEPAEGEFYYDDLVGLEAFDREGRSLGVVAEVFDNGANDVLVLREREGERELLIPFIDEVVVEVDLAGGKLLVEPLEGLLDQ